MNELLKILQLIEKPGSFCASNLIPPCILGLNVNNIGTVSFPLQTEQAKQLIAQAHQAPFGWGEQTLVDTNVRKVWELNPEQFTIRNPQWQIQLNTICHSLQTELGIKDEIVADIYKLLIYEKGSFFLPHRDTEKIERMFATLIVVLPSAYEGGELIICHDGEEKRFAFGGDNSIFEMRYIAFYADCQHEVKPVTSGYRVCLVYNLALANSQKTLPLAAKNSVIVHQLTDYLTTWAQQENTRFEHNEELQPSDTLRAVLLKHRYTEAEFNFNNLKGLDKIYAQVLTKAAQASDCQLHLGLVTLWEVGDISEYFYDDYGYGRGRNSKNKEEEYEIGEIIDSNLSINNWIAIDGTKKYFGEIGINEEQIISKKAIGSGKPDETEIEGPTGNAGATMDRWYHRAALVIWPKQQHFALLASMSQCIAVPQLAEMFAKNPADLTDCRRFASAIIDYWVLPRSIHLADVSKESGFFVKKMLQLLLTLDDQGLLVRLFNEVLSNDFSGVEGEEIATTGERYGWSSFAPHLQRMSEKTEYEALEAFSAILATLSEKQISDKALTLQLAQNTWHSLLKVEPLTYYYSYNAKSADSCKKSILVNLVKALHGLHEEQLLTEIGKHIFKTAEEFDLRTVVQPTLLEIGKWLTQQQASNTIFSRLFLQQGLQQFEQVATVENIKPTDWVRDSQLSCACENCLTLKQFLQSPTESVCRFKMRQDLRTHIENQIVKDRLDIDFTTEKGRSPHTLVCSKNLASFDRAVNLAKADNKMWQQLQKL